MWHFSHLCLTILSSWTSFTVDFYLLKSREPNGLPNGREKSQLEWVLGSLLSESYDSKIVHLRTMCFGKESVTALARSHINGVTPFERTKEQLETAETTPL